MHEETLLQCSACSAVQCRAGLVMLIDFHIITKFKPPSSCSCKFELAASSGTIRMNPGMNSKWRNRAEENNNHMCAADRGPGSSGTRKITFHGISWNFSFSHWICYGFRFPGLSMHYKEPDAQQQRCASFSTRVQSFIHGFD